MPYILTDEQRDILDTAVLLPSGSLLKVEAVAGASKTYTLIKLAEALHHDTNCLYLAYNKTIATEASEKFQPYVTCLTTHALAHYHVVRGGIDSDGYRGVPRLIGDFTHRQILEKIDYEDKIYIIQALEGFFLSEHTSLTQYLLTSDIPTHLEQYVRQYYDRMVSKDIPCTHGFYLKFFHVALASGHITYPQPFDLIMLDEAGDINAVTLQIFMLLPAHLKVMVGDSLQNIYSFNGTINGFKALEHVGVTKHLSQSFRCSVDIAERIEHFCRTEIDPDVVFRGTVHTDTVIRSYAILSRTNSGLISHMIRLIALETPFNCTRPAKEIFSTMLVLMNLKQNADIYDPRYKHIMHDLTHYYGSPRLQKQFKYPLLYIQHLYAHEDINIKAACQTIFQYGSKTIYEAYNTLKRYEESPQQYSMTLSTVHSSKGLTFDSVTIADDFDISDILALPHDARTPEDRESLRLYYVACSRARLALHNAKYL